MAWGGWVAEEAGGWGKRVGRAWANGVIGGEGWRGCWGNGSSNRWGGRCTAGGMLCGSRSQDCTPYLCVDREEHIFGLSGGGGVGGGVLVGEGG